MSKSTTSRIFLVLSCIGLFALPQQDARAGSAFAGDFMAIGVAARALGMGGSYVAVVDGAESVYWNPAGLARTLRPQAIVEHSERFGGIATQDFAAYSMPITQGWIGIGLLRGAVDGITGSDSTSLPDPSAPLSLENLPDLSSTYTFSNTDYTVLLSYARPITRGMVAGATAKIISRSIGKDGAFGYGLDVGATWQPLGWLTVAANIRDLTGTRVSWDAGNTDVVHPTLHIGITQSISLPWTKGRLTISTSSVSGAKAAGYGGFTPKISGEWGNIGTAGAEYSYSDLFSLRFGSQNLGGAFGGGGAQITAGLGLRIKTPWLGSQVKAIRFDVAWQNHILNASYPMTITVEL